MHKSVAALITCHNRRDKTIACLNALSQQQFSSAVTLAIFLVDDGSTDGTAEEVRRRFPDVRILQGDGSLYWNGGMRLAFEAAAKEPCGYFLWLNDDTVLRPTAIDVLLRTLSEVDGDGVGRSMIVGPLCDEQTGQLTYGGVRRSSRWHRMRFEYVQPSGVPNRCDAMNGNCVLIPRDVADALGNLSPAYRHGMGDYDYALRAGECGVSVWVAPEYVGFCSRNEISGTWRDTALSLSRRWKVLTGPKGLPPREWRSFCRAHTGPLWLLFFLSPYLRVLRPDFHPGKLLKVGRDTSL
jgi:GT2 family glycosyltransferase